MVRMYTHYRDTAYQYAVFDAIRHSTSHCGAYMYWSESVSGDRKLKGSMIMSANQEFMCFSAAGATADEICSMWLEMQQLAGKGYKIKSLSLSFVDDHEE